MSRTLPTVAGPAAFLHPFSPRAAPRKRLISFARAVSCVRTGSFFSLTKKFSVSSRKLLRISEIVYHISPGTSSNRTKFRMKKPLSAHRGGRKSEKGEIAANAPRRGAGTKRGGFARQSGAKFPAYSHNPGDRRERARRVSRFNLVICRSGRCSCRWSGGRPRWPFRGCRCRRRRFPCPRGPCRRRRNASSPRRCAEADRKCRDTYCR